MLEYLFDSTTPPLTDSTATLFIVAIGLLIGASFVAHGMRKKLYPGGPVGSLLRRIVVFGVVVGVVGLFLIFLRQQGVYVVSARIVLFTWMLWVLAWAGILARRYMKDVPRIKERDALEAKRKKYLP